MLRIEFIFFLIRKSEELRKNNCKNRICLEIYPKRSNYSVEIRHYHNYGLEKWIILTNKNLEDEKEQQKIIKYLNQIT